MCPPACSSETRPDSRFAYALADQPTAAGPYVPAAATRYSSAGGTIEITHSATGVYAVRFAGLGRTPGQRDNVQVSAYNATSPVICKPAAWNAGSADLQVTVVCYTPNALPVDSRFDIMVAGAWAFGRTAPLAFAFVRADSASAVLDSSATYRNSTGGPVLVGHVAEGSIAMILKGLEPAWAARPAAIQISPAGQGARRCRLIAIDLSIAGLGINCTRAGGAPGGTPFSILWLQQGRASVRFGFAYAQNAGQTTEYDTDPAFRINSSGGAVRARKTSPGHYRVVFAGLGRSGSESETVLVQPFLYLDRVCDITSWGNTGASDLFVDVACFDPASTAVDTGFSVMVVQ